MGNCNNTNKENVNKDEMITRDFIDDSSKNTTVSKAKRGTTIAAPAGSLTVVDPLQINSVIEDNLIRHQTIDIPQQTNEEELKKLDEMISHIGVESTEDKMKSSTLDFILHIEERENFGQFLDEIKDSFRESFLFPRRTIQLNDGGFYSGTWNSNFQKHGLGALLMKDGSKYCGSFINDSIHGKGYFIDTKGRVYVGDFDNWKAHGKGKIISEEEPGYLYVGSFSNNLYEGYGEEHQPNGNIYTGNFQNGYKHGNGVLKYSDGSYYDGEFFENKIQGNGTYKWTDGRIYKGDFYDNKLNGKGITTWSDGSFYKGDYKNDQFHGYGVLQFSDGSIFEGNWLNSMTHGVGYYKDSISEYKGLWRYNKNIKKF